MSAAVFRVANGHILRKHQIRKGDLWFQNGYVIEPQAKADHVIDAKGLLIAPGYIDLQVNGGFGRDFTSEPESLPWVAERLTRYGVTSFLATVVSSSPTAYRNILPILRMKKLKVGSARCLGLHLEGPFLNSLFAGAHLKQYFFPSCSSLKDLEDCYGSLEGVRCLTLASELVEDEALIRELRSHGIHVLAGHTDASSYQVEQSIQQGIRGVTHLFNAMRPFHHREPGWIGYVLADSSLYYSLIADGKHVHPQAAAMAWRANPRGCFLVSDASAALGAKPGHYSLGSAKIVCEEGGSYLAMPGMTLAGGACGVDQAVRNLMAWTSCTPVEALEAASWVPATFLGIQKQKGHLEVGADADFLFLDDDLKVYKTFVKGKEAIK